MKQGKTAGIAFTDKGRAQFDNWLFIHHTELNTNEGNEECYDDCHECVYIAGSEVQVDGALDPIWDVTAGNVTSNGSLVIAPNSHVAHKKLHPFDSNIGWYIELTVANYATLQNGDSLTVIFDYVNSVLYHKVTITINQPHVNVTITRVNNGSTVVAQDDVAFTGNWGGRVIICARTSTIAVTVLGGGILNPGGMLSGTSFLHNGRYFHLETGNNAGDVILSNITVRKGQDSSRYAGCPVCTTDTVCDGCMDGTPMMGLPNELVATITGFVANEDENWRNDPNYNSACAWFNSIYFMTMSETTLQDQYAIQYDDGSCVGESEAVVVANWPNDDYKLSQGGQDYHVTRWFVCVDLTAGNVKLVVLAKRQFIDLFESNVKQYTWVLQTYPFNCDNIDFTESPPLSVGTVGFQFCLVANATCRLHT